MAVKLHELKNARAEKIKRMREIAEKDDAPSDAEGSEFDSLKADVAALDARITRLEEVIASQAETAAEVTPGGEDESEGEGAGGDEGKAGAVRVQRATGHGSGEPAVKTVKGSKATRFLIGFAYAKSGGGFAGAAQWMERTFGDKAVAKALNTTGVATGGALIPQDFVQEVIDLMRADVVVRRNNPMSIPMPYGNATIPRLAASATAGYQGELDDIAVSQQSFDDVQMNAKKLTALVPVSNDLIRRSPIALEPIVRNDMVMSLARREDIAFLRGDGSGNSPIGFLNQCAAANKLIVAAFAAQDNATLVTAVTAVLNGMVLTLDMGMSPPRNRVWIMSPVVQRFLMGLRDQVGNYIFKDEMATGKLWGYSYDTTQQIPNNLNTGTTGSPVNNGTELYLVDFADVLLGETLNMVVDVSDQAAYKDGGGNMVSTFQRDQTIFRVIEEHDLALRHQASVAVGVLPGWAPAGYTGGPGVAYYVQAPTGDSSAAPSTFGTAAPTGANNPGSSSAAVPGGTLPGRP